MSFRTNLLQQSNNQEEARTSSLGKQTIKMKIQIKTSPTLHLGAVLVLLVSMPTHSKCKVPEELQGRLGGFWS